DGVVIVAQREMVDEVLRHPESFTSRDVVLLGNVRPLIPLGVDPPEHVKYRKNLDPLFAPRRMDAIEEHVTAQVNHPIDDMLDICFLILIAGLDTVTDSLTCFFAHLAQQPDRRHQLVENPAVIPAVVEELLRWETPVPSVVRQATADGELGGCPYSAGDLV